jgi:hypothetical protein
VLEKIIWTLCLTYITCYFYALLKAPEVIFGNADVTIDDQRGLVRLFVPGRSFVYLAYFLALSKYLKFKATYWLSISIVLFGIIVMHVIRQYILFSFLIGFFVVFDQIKWWKKIAVIGLVFFGISYLYEQLPFLQKLVELSEGQVNDNNLGEENIRITSYRYFFTDFAPNAFSAIFGNGTPHETSSYGNFYVNTINQKGLYMTDVGYAQIYALFGGLGLFLFGFLFYKAISQKKIPVEFLYTKWFVLFVAFSNIMSGLALNNSSIICLVFVFYILEVNYRGYNPNYKIFKKINKIE